MGDAAALRRRPVAAASSGHAPPRPRARRPRRNRDHVAHDPLLRARCVLLHRRGAGARAIGPHVDARGRPLRDARRAVLMVLDVLGTLLLGLGLLLATIGLYGLLRMPDIFHQLHPAGLITGPAVILVLLAGVATANAEIITSAV